MTPWTEEPDRLQSMGFSRQEYRNGLPFFFPRDLPDPGIKLRSPALQAVYLLLSHQDYGVGEDSCKSLGLQGDPTGPS